MADFTVRRSGGGGTTNNKGFWDASSPPNGSPDYATTLVNTNDYFTVMVGGTITVTGLGSTTFLIGDLLVKTSTGFSRIPNSATDLSNLSEGDIPMLSGGELRSSPLSMLPAGQVDSNSDFMIPDNEVMFVDSTVSGQGSTVVIKNQDLGQTIEPVGYRIDNYDASRRPQYRKRTTALQVDVEIQDDDTTTIPSVTQFDYTETSNQFVEAFYINSVNVNTNFRFIIRDVASNNIVKYFPDEQQYTAGTGVSLSIGKQRLEYPTPSRQIAGRVYRTEILADNPVSLRGNSSNIPYVAYDRQLFESKNLVDIDDLNQSSVEITSDITITPANLSTYQRAILFTPASQSDTVSITIQAGLTDLRFFDVCVLGTGALRVITQGAERVNGETDIRFTQLEGGRIKQVSNGIYSLIFDNTDPDMTDDYIDNARLDGTNLILENSNSGIGDITVDLSTLAGTEGSVNILNATGAVIPRSTPIVLDVNASGTIIGLPATEILLGGVESSFQQNRIYGFTNGTVNIGATFTVTTNGASTFPVNPEPSAGTTVWVEIVGGNLQLTTENLMAADSSRVYGVAGYVTTPNAVSGLVDVYLSTDLLDKSRSDRISVPFEQVVSHTASGVQNYGQEVSGKIHVLAPSVTAFDLLTAATVRNSGLFSIVNQNSSQIEFDVSATGLTFGGDGSSNAYNIPGNSTTLFYAIHTVLYPIGSTAVGAGGASDDHPVTLTRDTPSLSELNTLAQASLDDNSALWVVASDQVQATEDNVDSSIMIRALKSGLLDANNSEISTSSVQKSTVRLQGGTVVRIFSNTDLRIVSTPTVMARAARFPDIFITGGGPLSLVGSQVLYNTYRNRTAVLQQSTGTYSVYLPSLQNAVDLAYLNRSDVFCFRNASTNDAIFRIRTFQVGTFFSDNTQTIDVMAGQTLCVTPAPSGFVWSIIQFGQSTDITLDPLVMSDWYRDGADATAVDNSVRQHLRKELENGVVRDHIQESSSTNNPISLRFRDRNINDNIAWIQWWTTFDSSVPALGASVEEIQVNVPTALTYIQTNINNGYDFEINDPNVLLSISYITYQTGTTLKIGLVSALPSYIVVNDEIEIKNNSFGANNGNHAITSIYPDRLAFDITLTGSSAANDTGASGFIERPMYADAVLVSHDLRQVNFNLYRDSGRTSPITHFESDWFDITTEPVPASSILNIGYNTGISIIEPILAIEDEAEEYHAVLGGARSSVHWFDNTDPDNYQNLRYLPLNYADIHIRTSGVATFFFDIDPSDLPIGERRLYNIYSDLANDDDDVTIGVGRSGANNFTVSDEGLNSIAIRNGVSQKIEIYNDGNRNGWRLASPFSRLMPSAHLTNVVTPSSGPIAMSIAEIVAAENEDPNYSFMSISNNKFRLKGAFDYDIMMLIRLRFDGNEDTGLSFVNCSLVPTLTRSSTTTDITRVMGNTQTSLFFVRNGNNDNDNTKPTITLTARLRHQAQTDDEIGFELRFGTFPTGYSLSNLRQIGRQYSIQVTGGID